MKRILALAALLLFLSGSPAGEKGTVVELDGMKSKTPDTWEVAKPSTKLQMYRILLPKVSGDPKDGEMTIFHFGKDQGGGLEENVKRWKGMFSKPTDNRDAFEVGKAKMTVITIKGTYLEKFPPFDPNARVTERPDYRMFAVYISSPEGPFFIRAVGPEKTMEQHKKAFDGWLKAFK